MLLLNVAKEEVVGLAKLSVYNKKEITPNWKNINSGNPVIEIDGVNDQTVFFLDIVNAISVFLRTFNSLALMLQFFVLKVFVLKAL